MLCICGPKDNEIQFTISAPAKRRFFFMLGSGADSSVLLYLLCLSLLEEKRNPDTELKYIITLPKSDGAEEYAGAIVAWINKKLNLNLPEPIIEAPPGFNEMPHDDILKKSIAYFSKKYGLSYVFLGDQQTVPAPYKISQPYPKRYIPNPYPELIGMPFENLDKSHTIDLFYRYNVQELLTLTHSCTELRRGRCGQCYQCLERQWGFDRLGQTDPGVK